MLERMAIDNALQSGRGGLGVVMVRSGGNRAEFGGNVNDDGYANDPGVIAVGAVGDSGRVASYSSPGACVLVSGPSGDTGFKKLVTTDLSGTDGINNINFPSDLADYAYNSLGFSGTSGSSPIVAGVVALMLSVNPDLSVRDVQQILILSSGQTDTMNPNIRANGSGFPFSHLTGFGVPDAGLAVQLAEGWVARPAPMEVEYSSDVVQSVKDGGLTVRLQGDDVPVDLISIPASSGDGIVPDEPTAQVSLVDVGMASAEIMQDLTGKGALIQRGENKFFEKIDFAAAAGAELAIIYNNTGGDQRLRMGGTEYTTIPAVFIGQNDGEALRDQIATNLAVTAGMTTDQTFYDFEVTESLICEHVGVTVDSTHTSRGDLRIILVSPSGTKSVLQVPNLDTSAGPQDWTYWSVQHFFEPTKGTWQVGFSDQLAEGTGDVLSVKLTLRGVAISDVDKDGLDDFWEQSVFGNLLQSAPGDPDGDGFGNLFEQVASMNPVLNETPFQMGAHRVFDDIVRLSWPSVEGQTYSVESMDDLGEAFQQVEQVTGRKHETEMILPASALRRFLRVGELP